MDKQPQDGRIEHSEKLDAVIVEDVAAVSEIIDASISYDTEDERKLRRKTDMAIVPVVASLYLFCFIDRANIGNARLAGFEVDLGLKGFDYNMVLSIFYISYTLLEIPAMILCKAMTPGWFLPLTTIGFGVASIATAFVHTKAQVCAVRFLLGVFESGLMPGIAYYLSRWYCRSELTFRLGLYIVMAPLSGAFGGLLASGILKLDSFGSLTRWRMIFAIEGTITVVVAVIALFVLTDRPETARWLSDREKRIAVQRIRSERTGDGQVIDKMDTAKLRRGIANPVVLSTASIFLLNNVTVLGISFFTPTLIKAIYPGRTTVHQQLLSVPPYIVGAVFVIGVTLLSRRMNKRQIFLPLAAPMVMVGYAIFLGTRSVQARYAAIFLMCSSAFTLGALANANVSANVTSDTSRAVALGTNVMFGNVGGLIATWIYIATDAPNYSIGNGVSLACCGGIVVIGIAMRLWMVRDNRKRDRRQSVKIDGNLAGLSAQEMEDLDWRHPDFRWRL